ncbi:MAG: galactosyldiacylglycerol synthase [Anaerolineae bacterium]|nr:galactosyldiacylglycerol synthase [Anaerolineae bacterium]
MNSHDPGRVKPRRVVFFMSDTGGGHRAACDAIRAAMEQRYPGAYTFTLVDVYRWYMPFPFRYMPELYPHWVNYAPLTWGLGFWLINARYRDRIVTRIMNMMWARGIRRLVAEHPADVIVSVHPVFARTIMHAYNTSQRCRPPFVTVITDLVTTPAFWYVPEAERCLVPTQAAYDRGLLFGMRPDQLRVTGLPVHPRFAANLPDRETARRRLNWLPDRPAVLVVGGGDGMGPVHAITRAINRHRLPVQLAIIAGRNRALQRRLEAERWHQPTHIYPFVIDMAVLMAAADILVTKAGPGTIAEACAAGLPMVISGAVPGQENGNVRHVVNNGAGVYTPGAQRVAETVAAWLAEGPEHLAARADRARALARPLAAQTIAEELHIQAQRAPLRTRFNAQRQKKPVLRPAPEDDWVI